MRLWGTLTLAAMLAASPLGGATAQEPSADLVAKAKAEGRVVYYTDLIVDQIVRPLVAAFEAKYGIKVDYARADSQDTMLKVLGEHQAGNMQADVFVHDERIPGRHRRRRRAPVRRRQRGRHSAAIQGSETLLDIVELLRHDAGHQHRSRQEGRRPKTFDDLLAPRWKDKIVWKPNDMSGAPGFIANVLRTMGEQKGMEYLRKLGARTSSPSMRARAPSSIR